MANKLFQISAQVVGVKTRPSKTLEVKLETNDLSTFTQEQLASLMGAFDKQYWIAFAEQPLKLEDIDTTAEQVEKGSKTASQRLRGVLFRLWEQKGSSEEFELFYKIRMEKIIDQVREKLE